MLNKSPIFAIIIDDEQHNCNLLRNLLTEHCPEVEVIAEANNADDAFIKIKSLKPKLVFLDIKMPEKSGFELLRMFNEITFDIVFVSAFNDYAITAFEFNALDYILKPIDYLKLKKAVSKAVAKARSLSHSESILHFIKTLDEANDLISKFSVHHNGSVCLVNVKDVFFLEANGDYVTLHLASNNKYTSSKTLKQFEDVLRPLDNFIRINKSVIINTQAIRSYSKGEICIIELMSGHRHEVSRRKKAEILGRLKSLIY